MYADAALKSSSMVSKVVVDSQFEAVLGENPTYGILEGWQET